MLLPTALVALATTISVFGNPIPIQPPAVEFGEVGIWHPVNSTSNSTSSSLTRRDDVPPECAFGGSRDAHPFYYIQMHISGHTACIGWAYGGETCGKGGWGDPDNTDVQNAVAQQTTKDGQFESSTVGSWKVSWQLGTTAVPNRDDYTIYFDLGWAYANTDPDAIQDTTYYFSLDGNFIEIDRQIGVFGACPHS